MKITNTEHLRDDVEQIRADLRAGKISNTVARTLIMAAKSELDSLKLEIEAARLGSDFRSVEFHEDERNKKLRAVA